MKPRSSSRKRHDTTHDPERQTTSLAHSLERFPARMQHTILTTGTQCRRFSPPSTALRNVTTNLQQNCFSFSHSTGVFRFLLLLMVGGSGGWAGMWKDWGKLSFFFFIIKNVSSRVFSYTGKMHWQDNSVIASLLQGRRRHAPNSLLNICFHQIINGPSLCARQCHHVTTALRCTQTL